MQPTVSQGRHANHKAEFDFLKKFASTKICENNYMLAGNVAARLNDRSKLSQSRWFMRWYLADIRADMILGWRFSPPSFIAMHLAALWRYIYVFMFTLRSSNNVLLPTAVIVCLVNILATITIHVNKFNLLALLLLFEDKGSFFFLEEALWSSGWEEARMREWGMQ